MMMMLMVMSGLMVRLLHSSSFWVRIFCVLEKLRGCESTDHDDDDESLQLLMRLLHYGRRHAQHKSLILQLRLFS